MAKQSVLVQDGRFKLDALSPEYPLGRYGKYAETKDKSQKTKIDCPYCHDVLWKASHVVMRVVDVGRLTEPGIVAVKYQQVPKTHVVLKCRGCQSEFTTLRSRLSRMVR